MRRRSAPSRTPSTTSTSTRPKRARASGEVRPARAFADRLGLPVRDLGLLEQALVHASWLHEHPEDAPGHNERLEFLGDAVVNLIISEALYTRHPDDDEGDLSARRAAIVSTTGLARLAGRIDLGSGADARRGRIPAQRPPSPDAAGVVVRGARRRPLPRPRVRGRPRLAASSSPGRSSPADAPIVALKSPKSRLQELTQQRTGGRPSYHLRRGERSGPREDVPHPGHGRRRGARGRRGVVAADRGDRGRGRGPRAPPADDAATRRRSAHERRQRARDRAASGAASTARPPPPGLQVVRRADERRVRRRDQRGRRTERVGQEQPRRRAPLGARRAGPGAPLAQVRGRHLGRAPRSAPPRAWPTSRSSSTTPTGCCPSSSRSSSSAGACIARARTTTS